MFKLNINRAYFEDIDKNYVLTLEGKKMFTHAVIEALHDFRSEQANLFQTTLNKETMKLQFLSYFLDLANEYLGGDDDFEQVTYFVDFNFDHIFYNRELVKPVNPEEKQIKFDVVIHRRDTGSFEYPEKLVHFIIHNTPRIADKKIREDFASLKVTTKKSTNRDVIVQGYDYSDEGPYIAGYQLGIFLNFYHFRGVAVPETKLVQRYLRLFNDGEEVTEALHDSLFVTIIPEPEEI